MKLKDLGEFGFIDRIARLLTTHDSGIVKGIGDDCAVIRISGDTNLLVTTDLLIERTHFLLDWQSAQTLGSKALSVNLSDIAACGGIPKEAFVSLAIPDRLGIEWLEDFYVGMASLADRFEVSVIGGDTTHSLSDLVINVVVTGLVGIREVLFRNGARPGDIIAVTGRLGDSAAGLESLRKSTSLPSYETSLLIDAHLNPRPHIQEGRKLAQSHVCHAAIDISDGLSSDLGHICEQSGVGAIIFEDKIPVSGPLKKLAQELAVNPFDWVLNGGEDYVLLAAIDKGNFHQLAQFAATDGWTLTEIGEFVSEPGITLSKVSGEKISIRPKGWDHFRS
ncbi:MAG: thiamine-phosphate kinase [Desulfomonilaceae bacterium]|jgi:thiamine-monophosphate kinase